MKIVEKLLNLIKSSKEAQIITAIVGIAVVSLSVVGGIYLNNAKKITELDKTFLGEKNWDKTGNETLDKDHEADKEIEMRLKIEQLVKNLKEVSPDEALENVSSKTQEEQLTYYQGVLDKVLERKKKEEDKNLEEEVIVKAEEAKKEEAVEKPSAPAPEPTPDPQPTPDPAPQPNPDPAPQPNPEPTPQSGPSKKYDLSKDNEDWWAMHGIDIQSIEPFTPFYDNYNKSWNIIVDYNTHMAYESPYINQLIELIQKDFPNKQCAASGGYFTTYNGENVYRWTAYCAER